MACAIGVRGGFRWLAAAAALIVAAVAVSVAGLEGAQHSPLQPSTRGAAALNRLHSLPLQAQGLISSTVGADNRVFAARRTADGGFALAGGGVRASVRSGVVSLNGLESMVLEGWGNASATAHGNRMTLAYPGLAAWYAAGPLGVEQGFTVAQHPAGVSGRLTLDLRLGGSLHPRLAGSEVEFGPASGGSVLRYGGLSAIDATGRHLPASLGLQGSSLLLRVDDRGARYPVRIDPFLQAGPKLTASGEKGAAQVGYSAALSSDGRTALLGGYADNNFAGAAWVFTRSGATWSQQTEITSSRCTGCTMLKGELGSGVVGASVALSSDGHTALLGGPGDNSGEGAAWVFTRSGSKWSQQTEFTSRTCTGCTTLTGEDWEGVSRVGNGVALSSDGRTALLGGPDAGHNSQTGIGVGAAWVFTRSGSTWSQQTEFTSRTCTGCTTVRGEDGSSAIGTSVALSSHGNTALLGGPGDWSGGAAWVFTRSGTKWSQQTEFTSRTCTGCTTLTGEEDAPGTSAGSSEVGSSVALSADGNTALLGAPADGGDQGAAWMFTRSGATWSQQTEIVGHACAGCTPVPGAGGRGNGSTVGSSVALSPHARTVLVGGRSDNHGAGAAWMFVKPTKVATCAASFQAGFRRAFAQAFRSSFRAGFKAGYAGAARPASASRAPAGCQGAGALGLREGTAAGARAGYKAGVAAGRRRRGRR